MGTGRTTQRVVCPSCGELLRPTPELLLGLDGIACKCGFRAADRMPGAQHPKAGPNPRLGPALLVAGGLSLVAAVVIAAVLAGDPLPPWAGPVLVFLLADGVGGLAFGWHHARRARHYAECAHLLGDMIVRRSLVDGVRRIYREQGAQAARAADGWLRDQGVSSREFRRDLMRDARGVARA